MNSFHFWDEGVFALIPFFSLIYHFQNSLSLPPLSLSSYLTLLCHVRDVN